MTDCLKTDLHRAGFRGEVETEAPLAPLTTWRIGGPAELLATPSDRADVALAVAWAARRSIAWRVLGNGSNLLVRDAGVRGLVLRVRRVLDDVERLGDRIVAGAGASFPGVARLAALGNGLSGIEFAAGIPGTIGGAIVMNAGWHEFEIGNVTDSVAFLTPDGTTVQHGREACGFGYRRSRFRTERGVVLGATLKLAPGPPVEIEGLLERFAGSRKQNQPTDMPSCGSVFLKPEGDFAGRLIDEAGLKGLRVGDVQVSPRHANFFVNLGSATSRDALTLVERVENEVERRFGVRLTREFELW